jgi:ribosome maturation factor RimP
LTHSIHPAGEAGFKVEENSIRERLRVHGAGSPGNIEFPRETLYSKDATSLSALFAVGRPAGGEMSGLTAHFLFGANFREQEAVDRVAVNWPENSIRDCAARELMAVKLEEIRAAAQRVAASHGLDVVEVEFSGRDKERILRVTLEKNAEGRAQLRAAVAAGVEGLPERLAEGRLSVEQLSGITHEDCASFSRDFGVLLDVEDLIPGSEYTLEASSPGLDRKLTRREEFERFAGSLVKVQTFEPVRNNRHWQGRLAAGAGETITLDLAAVKQNSKSRKAGVNTVEIALTNVEKAQLIPEI